MRKCIKVLTITATLVIIILANSFGVNAQSSQNSEMNFSSIPTLISGDSLAVGQSISSPMFTLVQEQ
jgi:hypothetical protein